MTDNIIDNEIIKALECCIKVISDCNNCPYYDDDDCENRLIENALDLIHRQKAEIERLKDFIEKDKGLILKLTSVPKNEYDNKIKSEAIKEFAEKVDEILCLEIGPSKRGFWKISEGIKNLVKEMTH